MKQDRYRDIRFLFIFVVSLFCFGAPAGKSPTVFSATPILRTDSSYADESRCAECHEKACNDWRQSDHSRAMDHATEKTVLGNFSNIRFLHIGFDDLLDFDDAAVKMLLNSVEVVQSPEEVQQYSMRSYTTDMRTADTGEFPLNFIAYNTRGRKFKPPLEPHFNDFALSCFDAKDGVKEKLRRNMTDPQREEFDAEMQYRTALRTNRPCDITTAQYRIVNRLRQLIDEKKILPGQIPEKGTAFRMFRRNEKFMVETDSDGKPTEYEVLFTLGIRPLQQYLVEIPGGRLQCLPVVWDTVQRQWFHLYPKEQIVESDPLHWRQPLQNWNYMCADCHTTAFEKNFDTKILEYGSTFVQKNVSCQSCHGPCSKHAETARKHGLTDSWKDGVPMQTDMLTQVDAAETLRSCASCHTRRRVIRSGAKPPLEPSLDYFVPEMQDRPIYYPDGQLLEEAFEIGSFMQSKMYSKGVSCINCHDPHSLELKYEGNRLCTQCHSPSIYDTPRHHFHPDDTKPGTQCVECHFPQSTFMVVDARRDHSIRKPSPALSKRLGVPNSCTICHHDRTKGETLSWAGEHVDRWYETSRKSLVGHSAATAIEEHYGVAIDAGRRGDPKSQNLLASVVKNKTDRDHRDIIRASALALFGQLSTVGSNGDQLIFESLEDRSELVRLAAVEAFSHQPPEVKLKYLRSKLSDPLAAIRIETVRVLADVSDHLKDETEESAFAAARKEFVESCNTANDRGASYLNLAVFEYDSQATKRREVQAWFDGTMRNLGQREILAQQRENAQNEAIRVRNDYMRRLTTEPLRLYRQSIRVEPTFIPSRINLAMLYNERGETSESEKQFREVLRIDPKNGDAAYSLALLLAETGQFDAAEEQFRTAIKLQPENARIRYNLGLLLMQRNKRTDAATQLQAALKLEPENIDFLYALTVFHLQGAERSAAIKLIDRLIKLDPSNRQWTLLKQRAEQIPER